MRTLPQALSAAFFFVLLLALCLSQAPVFGDPDTAWHLASGDLIRAAHAIPMRDPWSFTAPHERWYNLSWLFDMGLSSLYSAGGFSAIYALTLAVFSGALAFMAGMAVRRGAGLLPVAGVVALSAAVVHSGVLARPNLCSIVLTLIFYQALCRYRETGKAAALFPLPFLMLLWANLHGGFLLAFVMFGIFFAEAAWNRDRRRMQGYIALTAACLATTLVNPYGFALYYGAWRTLAAPFAAHIIEWRPIEIGRHWSMTALLALLLLAGNGTDRRIALSDRLLVMLLILLALSGIRHAMIAALLVIPYLSLCLTFVLEERRWGRWLLRWDRGILDFLARPSLRIAASLMALLAIAFVSLPSLRDRFLDETPGFADQEYPEEEAAYVAAHYPGKRFLNHYDLGGYLDYLWRGRMKVFVDGRASSLFSDDLLKDYADFMDDRGMGGRAELIAAHYRLDGLILPNDRADAGHWKENPHWRKVYRGEVATVFVKASAKR